MEQKELSFAEQRSEMVKEQLVARGIKNTAVLHAFQIVPRELFVPDQYHDQAYRDGPLPLPGSQTISQPYVVAMMVDILNIQPDDKVLEIGCGSGYAAAIISRLARHVYTVERIAELADYGRTRLAAGGFDNVTVIEGDGTMGLPTHAPFNAIIAAASGPRVPTALLEQLAVNGRLIMPTGKRKKQRLILVERMANGRFHETKLSPVRFVPLIGKQGWKVKK